MAYNLIEENKEKLHYIMEHCSHYLSEENRHIMLRVIGIMYCLDNEIGSPENKERMAKGCIDLTNECVDKLKKAHTECPDFHHCNVPH